MQEFAKIVWNRLEHLLYFIFVKLLHLTFLDKNWAGFMQFVKFGMVGLSNTLLSYILNVMVLLILMPFSAPISSANISAGASNTPNIQITSQTARYFFIFSIHAPFIPAVRNCSIIHALLKCPQLIHHKIDRNTEQQIDHRCYEF